MVEHSCTEFFICEIVLHKGVPFFLFFLSEWRFIGNFALNHYSVAYYLLVSRRVDIKSCREYQKNWKCLWYELKSVFSLNAKLRFLISMRMFAQILKESN